MTKDKTLILSFLWAALFSVPLSLLGQEIAAVTELDEVYISGKRLSDYAVGASTNRIPTKP